MNKFNFDFETQTLKVTRLETASLEKVKHIISLNKPMKTVDKFITLYLRGINENNLAEQAWYEQQLLVESLDQDEVTTEIIIDDDGEQQEIVIDNPYTIAFKARTALEDSHEWLKSYRGENAADKPTATYTVEQFKTDNSELITPLLKQQGAIVGGFEISLTEENQNGIAAVLKGIELAEKYQQDIFPFKFNAATASGNNSIEFADQTSFEVFALEFMGARQAFFS